MIMQMVYKTIKTWLSDGYGTLSQFERTQCIKFIYRFQINTPQTKLLPELYIGTVLPTYLWTSYH